MLNQALQMQRQKKRVLVVFENGLCREDHLITTRTFPFYFSEVPQLTSDLKKWRKIISTVPHLFQPQKVIYLGFKRIGYLKSLVADVWFKNEYQKKSFKLKNINAADFSFLKANPQEGIIFQEYRFNISRFFIEMLKFFESEGGKVLLKQIDNISKQELRIRDASTVITGDHIFSSGPNFQSVIKIPVQSYKNFEMVVRKNHSFFRFSEDERNVKIEPVQRPERTFSEKEMIEIASAYFFFRKDQVTNLQVVEVPAIEDISNILSGINGDLPCSFPEKGIDDNYEMCLEKYDLARQTGISFAGFTKLFHRYGAAIDEIMEAAYNKLNSEPGIKEIWKMAEEEYQEKHEWLNS